MVDGPVDWVRQGSRALVALIVLLVLAGCGEPEIQPLLFNDMPWQDGETSLYDVSDRNGDYAGTVLYTITAGGAVVGEQGWTIRREVNTQGDMELVAVEVTDTSVRPLASMLVRDRGSGVERVETAYNQGQIDMTLTTSQDVTTYERSQQPSDVRDQRTLLMMARALPLTQGYATRFYSFLPVANLRDRVTLQVLKSEEVTVPAGTFDTWAVTLTSPETETKAWIGRNAPYPLVKYEDGLSGGTYELTDFQPGG